MNSNIKFIIILVFVVLGGCDRSTSETLIQRAVLEKLKDPESAKFKKIIISQNNACVEVNAKNSYGAYSGYTSVHLRQLLPDKWVVEDMDGGVCRLDIIENKIADNNHDVDRYKNSEGHVVKILKEKNLINRDLISADQIKNAKCRDYVFEAITFFDLSINEKDEFFRKHYLSEFDAKVKIIGLTLCK